MVEIPNDLGGHPVLQMDTTYHETLKWINRVRRKHGKGGLRKIRKGNHSGYSCPIANSLADCFKHTTVYASRHNFIAMDELDLMFPDYVTDFVKDFDARRKYRELYDGSR